MESLEQKYDTLKSYLSELGSVGVAFSSGVDSTLVLWVAHEVLGEKALALTASSEIFPPYEMQEAREFCESYGIKQLLVPIDPFALEGYENNPINRCYICKTHLFSELLSTAQSSGIAAVADGTNKDDVGKYRPGMQALEELAELSSIRLVSPLKELDFTKTEIRELSKQLGLPTWDKATYACLMTRFEYGQQVTEALLDKVGRAELYLLNQGFRQLRVRYRKGEQVSIELAPEEIERLLESDMAARVDGALKDLGFTQVSVDPEGYTSGKMDEGLEGIG